MNRTFPLHALARQKTATWTAALTAVVNAAVIVTMTGGSQAAAPTQTAKPATAGKAPAPAGDKTAKAGVVKPPAVVYSDPSKVEDADFAIQGEYLGKVGGEETGKTWAAQVIARGGGAFEVYWLAGGLPGAGWDGQTRLKAMAKTVEGVVTISDGPYTATIRPGTDQAEMVITGQNREGQTLELRRVTRRSPTLGAAPPEGAVVLFNGQSAEAWNRGRIVEQPDGHHLNWGVLSKARFTDFTLHLEFRLPFMPHARGQGRANSGVYLQNRYECQILDSFGLTGEDNECGGFYKAARPRVNMCLPPLVWQTYDIDFTAARYDDQGQKTADARVSVRHNGVVIHEGLTLKSATPGGIKEGPEPGGIQLQDHGNPVVFRNIWVVEKNP